jgi:hypothetical protein
MCRDIQKEMYKNPLNAHSLLHLMTETSTQSIVCFVESLQKKSLHVVWVGFNERKVICM